MLIIYLKLFTTQATQQLFEKTTKCCLLISRKNSGFLVLELEVKRNEEDLGKSHKKDTRE